MMKRTTLPLALVLLVIGASVASAQDVVIATSNPGNFLHSTGSAIAKVVSEKTGTRATVQPYASATVYFPGVNSGDIPFGIASITDVLYAYNGLDYFAGRKHSNLRVVAILYPMRNAIFVKKSSAIVKVADLKGHPMPDGYTSQKIIPPSLDAIYATAGLSRKDMKPVMVPNAGAGADAFMAGKVDGFWFAAGSAKVREADAAVGGVRVIKVENTPQNAAIIAKHMPGMYLRLEQPGPDNPGFLEPGYSLAYDTIIFANAKVPDDEVYKVAKAIYENKADLTSTFSSFALMEQKAMAKQTPIPYHPGAIKFYKEKGIWPGK